MLEAIASKRMKRNQILNLAHELHTRRHQLLSVRCDG
jgi:hypothetical protein